MIHDHFSSSIRTTVSRDVTIGWDWINLPSVQGGGLDNPFTEEEVWEDIKEIPPDRAPGPDGFTADFLRACWPIVKQALVDVFQQLYALRGRGFSCLNQALLTLLPKRADARCLGDYRPISLIHLVARIFAQVLSLRLAPKLNALVSAHQNVFV